MSNILNIKNLDGDWDSIVAIRGKQGEPGADGTKFEVNARFVPGNNVVPIADFITDKGTPKETTHTIYAPKGEGGGTTVDYTDLHTFADTITVGEISVDGETSEVVIPANVSEFANDAGYISETKAKIAIILDVEDGEVHNAKTSFEGWPSKIVLAFKTDFNGEYIDVYATAGDSRPVARVGLRYPDNTLAEFKAGEFCEVSLAEEEYGHIFVILARSYVIPTKVSELENDEPYVDLSRFLETYIQFSNETIAERFSASKAYNVGDYVAEVMSVHGVTTCVVFKCIKPCTFIFPTNTEYWEQVLITDEIKNSGGSTEKYMPGDVVYAGIIELYSASTGSSGVYILDKEVDESVSSISVEADTRAYPPTQQNPQYTMRGAGKTVSAPSIEVTVDDLNRKRLDLKTSERTTANYLNIVSWVKFVFS